MTTNSNRTRGRRKVSRGFTLIEMVLALTITVMVMTGVLNLFQMSARVARNQTQLSDLQQNLRVALYDTQRNARMAGRGGLPTFLPPTTTPAYAGKLLPNGVALTVGNNVGPTTYIGDSTTPLVLEGTDTLTVRGVLFGSVYQAEISVPDFAANRITVGRFSRMGIQQDLTGLAEAVDRANGGDDEALIVVSPVNSALYGIVEITGGTVDDVTVAGKREVKGVTMNFVTSGTTRQDLYNLLLPEGQFPSQMTAAGYVGVLEEYRYYVREIRADPADTSSRLVPRLSRARFYPGTNVVHPTNASAAEDISDNVWDMQIVLGVDQNGDGEVLEGADATAKSSDEWLFNSTGDTIDTGTDPTMWVWNGNPLELMRVNVLVRTDRRDLKYISPKITDLEDRYYGEPDVPATNAARADRQYRRRVVRSVIDFRNL